MLQQEIDYLKQQLSQKGEKSKQQLAQEKEESKDRHTELMRFLKEQKEKNQKLIDMLQQRLN